MHNLKDKIVAIAVLGLENVNPDIDTAYGAFGDFQKLINFQEPQRKFLAQAASLFLYANAGYKPLQMPNDIWTQAKEDRRPRCNQLPASSLGRILNGEQTEIINEWLYLLENSQRRVPEEHIAALIELGTKKPELQSKICDLVDARGFWLASLNPDWNWVTAKTIQVIDWQTATRAERTAHLIRLRSKNPSEACELLKSTWDEEIPDDKARFIEILSTGLSAGDETFLESVLSDRRKEVRSAAANMLSRLPQSAYCCRMIDRLKKLITFTPARKASILSLKLGKKASIEISLPEKLDPDVSRDTISPKLKQGETDFSGGEKAGWILQMLEIPSPSIWCEIWGTTPEELIETAIASEWKDLLLEAWTRATVRHLQSDWAAAIVKQWEWICAHTRYVGAIITILPETQRLSFLADRIQSQVDNTEVDFILQQLQTSRFPWPVEISRLVVQRLIPGIVKRGYDVERSLAPVAINLHPDMIDEGLKTGNNNYGAEQELSPAVRRGVDAFCVTLNFRKSMIDAFMNSKESVL